VAWKFRLPNRILNPARRGSELPMEYLWDLYSVRITIEMAGGKLIFSAKPPYLVRQLSVWKVVSTLTSTSAEIYLSMAGAKQHIDASFILVPVVGRTSSSRGALGVVLCCTVVLAEGATSVAGEEEEPPGP
jgi:hypothetical protein